MSFRLSVFPSVCPFVRFRGKRLLIKIKVWFFYMQIHRLYEHLFFKYLICQSVGQATKGRDVKIWKFLADIRIEVRIHLINNHLSSKYFVHLLKILKFSWFLFGISFFNLHFQNIFHLTSLLMDVYILVFFSNHLMTPHAF